MANYAKEDNGVLITFWDGKSKGTKHMIDLAKSNNIRVFIVNYQEGAIKITTKKRIKFENIIGFYRRNPANFLDGVKWRWSQKVYLKYYQKYKILIDIAETLLR